MCNEGYFGSTGEPLRYEIQIYFGSLELFSETVNFLTHLVCIQCDHMRFI